ncbi:extracellular solute-binding protein [Microbacterium proteolyticum]|uniref:sugar ABC transporter substrate-binding protein n=1 Tax=Microbacterium TaxID=33882 RepID=UPI002416E6B4|nr:MULTISPECIES: extracellular solute-binding protein [Microbacterium]MDI9890982.1 extracellular solute-binding protein [Microbacterium sp. IEGM 1404]
MASTSQRLRRVALPAAGLTAALALTACAGGQAAPAPTDGFDGVSLTVWNNIDFEPYQGLQKQYFEACAADLGITVDVQTQSGDYTTKLLQAAGAKALPDVALLSTDTQLPQLAAQGVLADLSSYDVSTDGLADSAADLGRYDGTLYGLPVQVEDYAIFYNKAAFAAAGVSETAPKTFDDLVKLAASLTTADQKGIVLPGIGGDGSTPVYFLPFLLSAGGDPADPTGTGAVEAVDLYKKLVDNGSLSSEFVNWGWDSIDQWTSGKTALTVSGPWNLVDTSIPFEWGTFPFPTATSGESPKVNLLGYAYGVAANADATKEAAAAALVKCRASEENQVDTAVQGGYIPALKSAQATFVEKVPAAAPFVDAVDGAYNSAQLGTEWNTLQQQYVDAIQAATVGGQTAQAALEQASGK